MKKFIPSLLTLSLALVLGLTAQAQQELSATTPLQEKALDWQSTGRSFAGLFYGKGQGHELQISRFHQNGSEMIIIPVQVENESCQGINTLGYALYAQNSFATGEYQNLRGHHIRDLFGAYQGRAIGGGALAGYGKWSSISASGLQLKKSLIALPVPALGGDIALGYTDCQISFSMSDQGQATYYGADHKAEVIDIKDIADWEL